MTPNKNIEEQVRNRIDMELELSPEDRAKLIRKFTSDIKKLLDQQKQALKEKYYKKGYDDGLQSMSQRQKR